MERNKQPRDTKSLFATFRHNEAPISNNAMAWNIMLFD